MGPQPSQRVYVTFTTDERRGGSFFGGMTIIRAHMLLVTKFFVCSCEAGKMTQW